MILSAHQPAYLPWLGYFDKISKADVFVFLDTVQYEKNSFINRNKIKTPQGPQWLTIPVKSKGHITATLRETLVDDSKPWRSKHLKSIEMNYRKAPYFNEFFPKLEGIQMLPASNLAELCWQQLQFWLKEFNIKTKVVRSSYLAISSKKSDLVLDLCRHFNADQYLSGIQGRDYLDESSFYTNGIAVQYQDFQHPIYTQLWGDFLPYISIIDYWMNCGSDLQNISTRRINGL